LIARAASIVLCGAYLLVAGSGAVAFAQTATRTPPAPPSKAPATTPPDSASARVPAVIEAEKLLDANRPKDAVPVAKRAVAENPNSGHAWFVLARAYHASGDLDAAIEAGHHAATFASVRASAYYNLACAYALKGDKESAFMALLGAKRAGFADRSLMSTDPDLASLRDDPRFVLPQERNFFTLKLKDGSELPFSVDLPLNFDPSKEYPVLVAPGAGKKVDGNWGGLFWGEDTSQRGWMAVESPAFVLADPIGVTAQLLDELARRYKVEGGKFHLVSYGPAAAPAFAVAMAMPARIKSITVVPGFPATSDDAELSKLKGVTVSFIVGENDPLFLNECEAAHRHLQKLGVDVYIEVVAGAGQLMQPMFGGELAERMDLLR
jgi:tetratricopeptide (TPR) repeat protein